MQSTEMSVIGSILMEPAFLGIARRDAVAPDV